MSTTESRDWADYSRRHPSPVPEPGFYGAILVGVLLGLLWWRRVMRD